MKVLDVCMQILVSDLFLTVVKPLFPVAVVLVLVVGIFLWLKWRRGDVSTVQLDEEWPYSTAEGLLTRAELSFFQVLRETLGEQYAIFVQVALPALVQVQKGQPHNQWQRHFNRLQSKRIDFVFCEQKTLQPILALELDDASHQKPSRQKRDKTLDAIFQAANFPLLHIPAQRAYDVHALKMQIQSAVSQIKSQTEDIVEVVS